jgi:hypothetical protein
LGGQLSAVAAGTQVALTIHGWGILDGFINLLRKLVGGGGRNPVVPLDEVPFLGELTRATRPATMLRPRRAGKPLPFSQSKMWAAPPT